MIKKLAFLLCLTLTLGLAGSNATTGATLDIRIATGNDDVEESVSDQGIDMTSSDLEFPYDTSVAPDNDQVIGLRWAVPILKGAKVTKAYLEVECDNVLLGTEPVNVIIQGQLAPNAAPFSSTAADLTSRPTTKAQVAWSMANYTAVNQKVQSPDLAAIIQEIIDQPEWVSGNALVLRVSDDKSNPSKGLRESESYDGEATAAPLLHIEVSIPQATNPDPADGATRVLMPLLNWTAGDGAVAHNVYVGTSATLEAANLVGPQQPVPTYFHVPGLEPGVTYYWRVDEIAIDGTVTTGKVWSFTAMPVAAFSPSPADGSVWQRGDPTLTWEAGTGAVSHKVYGGADKAAVAAGDASVLLAEQAGTSLALTGLKPLSIYYWRVDEVGAANAVVPGSVWSFQVVGGNVGSWRTAAADSGAGFLATFVQNGTFDIGTFGDEQTYEFIVRSNPDEKAASMALIGRLGFGDTRMGLKYEQWNNTKNYGATVFGVKDHTYPVPNAPGEFTHLAFVAKKAAATTDLYVNGVLKGSVPAAILLSGQVGIGRAIRADGTFVDDFDGKIFGVAIYNRALSEAEIGANSARFLLGGPEAMTLDLQITDGGNDAEEHLNAGMDIGSTDLEFPYEDNANPSATDEQLTVLRFVSVAIPKGAQVTKAYLEFEQDETKGNDKPVNVVVEAQLTANAPAIENVAKNLSGRAPWTAANVKWTVPMGMKDNDKFQSPDLAAVLNEIVNQEGWVSGNALALAVRDDKDSPSTGLRCVESVEGEPANAPRLHVEILIP